jgi:hypothetical protein
MLRFIVVIIVMNLHQAIVAQNVGIGVSVPTQKLDIDGAIKIGNSNINNAGSIRYNNNQFEGSNGNTWLPLQGVPKNGIIIAQEQDTSFIKSQGYSVLRTMDIWDTSNIVVPSTSPGSWSNGFPLSNNIIPSSSIASNETVQYNGQFIYYGNDGFLWAYNTSTDLWQQLPNVSPLGLQNQFGMTLVGNEIFITGGWRLVSGSFVIYNTAAKYNLLTNVWTTIANMPVANCRHVTLASGNFIYFMNGASTYSGGFINTTKLYRYNTTTNTWSTDLATASTPNFLSPFNSIGRNGKYIYSSSSVVNASGNTFLVIAQFDPATLAVTNLTPAPPFPSNQIYQFRSSKPLPTTSDKVLVVGYIADTTDINYNPANPNATAASLALLYEVTISTGVSVQHNSCKIAKDAIYAWQYNAADQLLYATTSTNNYFVFNKAGVESCNSIIQRKGYWSYMKKN